MPTKAKPKGKRRGPGKPFVKGDPRQDTSKIWKPGQSGNPDGYSKGRRLRTVLEHSLESAVDPKKPDGEKHVDRVVGALIQEAEDGSVPAIKVVFGYMEGGIPQPITGPGGGALAFEFDFSKTPDKDLSNAIETIRRAVEEKEKGGK